MNRVRVADLAKIYGLAERVMRLRERIGKLELDWIEIDLSALLPEPPKYSYTLLRRTVENHDIHIESDKRGSDYVWVVRITSPDIRAAVTMRPHRVSPADKEFIKFIEKLPLIMEALEQEARELEKRIEELEKNMEFLKKLKTLIDMLRSGEKIANSSQSGVSRWLRRSLRS